MRAVDAARGGRLSDDARTAPPSAARTLVGGLAAILVAGATRTAVLVGLLTDDGAVLTGVALGAATLVSAALAGATLAVVVHGHARAWLALARPPLRVVIAALALEVLVLAFTDGAALLLERPLLPAGAPALVHGPAAVALLGPALVVAAPVLEEVLFRGFLLGGLAATRIGTSGAVVVSALLFSLVHGPEDAFSFLSVLLFAVLLSVVRLRTGSIVPGVAMHALGNAKMIAHALFFA